MSAACPRSSRDSTAIRSGGLDRQFPEIPPRPGFRTARDRQRRSRSFDERTVAVQRSSEPDSGVLHGGVTATLIDTAMAFAVRTRLPVDEATATIDLTVHYLRPHVTGTLTCTAKVVRAGKRIFTVSADVVGADDKLIATAISTYTRV